MGDGDPRVQALADDIAELKAGIVGLQSDVTAMRSLLDRQAGAMSVLKGIAWIVGILGAVFGGVAELLRTGLHH